MILLTITENFEKAYNKKLTVTLEDNLE